LGAHKINHLLFGVRRFYSYSGQREKARKEGQGLFIFGSGEAYQGEWVSDKNTPMATCCKRHVWRNDKKEDTACGVLSEIIELALSSASPLLYDWLMARRRGAKLYIIC